MRGLELVRPWACDAHKAHTVRTQDSQKSSVRKAHRAGSGGTPWVLARAEMEGKKAKKAKG